MTHGPGDEHERPAAQDDAVGDRDLRTGRAVSGTRVNSTSVATAARRSPIAVTFVAMPCSAIFRLWAASTNPANSGCGRSGFDLNSGWNCTATIPRMARQLDDLDELAVERPADDAQAVRR